MMKQLSITRPATLENLPALLDAADAACLQAGASEDVRHAVRLAVEEVSVNVMTHGYANEPPGPITLALHWEQASRLTLEIIDRARAGLALHVDRAAHQVAVVLRNGQAHATAAEAPRGGGAVSYTHLRAHET